MSCPKRIYIGHLSPGAQGPQDEARLALDGGSPQPRGKVCMGGCLCGVNSQHRRTSDEGGEGSFLVEQTEGLYIVN